MKTKQYIKIILYVITCCIIVAITESIIKPSYAIKSIIKIFFFFILPFINSRNDQTFHLKKLFHFDHKNIIQSLLLGLIVYFVIILAFIGVHPFFDFSSVITTLNQNGGIVKENFLFVALYISFINSLIEEFFFRGFAYLTLKKIMNQKISMIFSSFMFAIYHIAIISGWFQPILFFLVLISLMIAGIIFNLLDHKSESIYTSWMVHMFANFAINTIGFYLFGLI